MRVDVYRNLNRRDAAWFSVRHKGLVVGYRQYTLLSDCRMKHASEKQLGEVRTGPRQVCQWINGELDYRAIEPKGQWRPLCCDPKKHDGFTDAETGERVDAAAWVRFDESGKVWYLPNPATCPG